MGKYIEYRISLILPKQTSLAHGIQLVWNSIRHTRDVTIQAGADLTEAGKSQVTFAALNSAKIAPV
jgi:hypothetical protein